MQVARNALNRQRLTLWIITGSEAPAQSLQKRMKMPSICILCSLTCDIKSIQKVRKFRGSLNNSRFKMSIAEVLSRKTRGIRKNFTNARWRSRQFRTSIQALSKNLASCTSKKKTYLTALRIRCTRSSSWETISYMSSPAAQALNSTCSDKAKSS